ncbi:uncharacterized protein LOC128336228 isoform X2 [Hemicordylus capensis]|uniref:uncharacterized protein LOC128336228 isoform X2 n=1 Tax=Hemicordylus capensis TaxID=884348 RepID=UPI002303091F|nr:uncharacterized protein LOC128336228 isoform X2 [Hemicordylus capensis]
MWWHRKIHPFPGTPVGGRRGFWERLHWAAAPILLFGCGRRTTAISPSKTKNMDPTASFKQPHADEETLTTVIVVSQDKDTLYLGTSGSTNGPSGSTSEWVPPEDVDPPASCKQPHADEETLRTVIMVSQDPTASCKQPDADEETLRTVIMVSQDKDTLYLGTSGSTNGPSGSTNEWVPPEDVDPTASFKQPHADEETLRTVIMVSQDPTASCKQPDADEETLRTVIMVSQAKDTLYGTWHGPSGSTNEWVPPEDVEIFQTG